LLEPRPLGGRAPFCRTGCSGNTSSTSSAALSAMRRAPQLGAMMLEQYDEWSLNRRYMQLEGLQTVSDTAPTRLSAVAR
jgi:hypothetical protein